MKCTIKVSEVKDLNKKGEANEPAAHIRGFATAVFGDSFKVTNIAILEKKADQSLFISMPRYRSAGNEESGVEYKNICNPITKAFRDMLYGAIMAAFQAKNFEEITFNDPEHTEGKLDFNVQVTPFQREGSNIRGLARVYLGQEFVINHIAILQGKNGEFIAMPNYKTKRLLEDNHPVYQDICYPITKEFMDKLHEKIFEVYQMEKAKKPPFPLPPTDEVMKAVEKDTPFR
ncbi:MAG: SpoVG family protein [Clostridiales bacterium]|nr:SpoVG family protein [Clostridiales bacterium]